MEATQTTPAPRTHEHIDVFDAHGRLVGTIIRPVEPDALGPGRQTVYLARSAGRRDSGNRAA